MTADLTDHQSDQQRRGQRRAQHNPHLPKPELAGQGRICVELAGLINKGLVEIDNSTKAEDNTGMPAFSSTTFTPTIKRFRDFLKSKLTESEAPRHNILFLRSKASAPLVSATLNAAERWASTFHSILNTAQSAKNSDGKIKEAAAQCAFGAPMWVVR